MAIVGTEVMATLTSLSRTEDVPLSREATKLAAHRAAWLWGSIVVFFLLGQIVIGITAIILSNSDPTVAVVPGYHSKAMLWDDSVEIRQQSQELGWHVKYRWSPCARGHRLTWTVCDVDGVEIQNPRGSLTLYHHARAGEPIVVSVQGPEQYVELERDGLWQAELLLESPSIGKRFSDSQVVELTRGR